MLKITDERLAAALLSPPVRRLLLAFVDRPLSVSQAAVRLEQPVERTYYHVTSLAKKGLLRLDRVEKRGGRPIKYYRAVADSFFVPLALLQHSPGAALVAELRASLDEQLFSSPDEGMLLFTEQGEPRISRVGGQQTRSTAGEFWYSVNLTPERLRAFSADLKALMDKHAAAAKEGRRYLLYAAFAPRKN